MEKNRKDFPFLFELLTDKKLTFDKFENFYRQMINSHMTGILATCKKYYTYDMQLLIEKEKHWKSKYETASKKLKNLTSTSNIVAKSHLNNVELNMQTLLCSKKEDLPQLPNVTVYLKQSNNEHANITDHNNIVLLDKIDYFKPSTSNSIIKKASKKHPAPLPHIPKQRSLITWGRLPLAPNVTVSQSFNPQHQRALVLSWNMPNTNANIANVISYHVFAYCENPSEISDTVLWKQIGDIDAVTLPMTCSLIEYVLGATYHFAVRAMDEYSRVGPFSIPYTISV